MARGLLSRNIVRHHSMLDIVDDGVGFCDGKGCGSVANPVHVPIVFHTRMMTIDYSNPS
jgi:hypothetical protein